MSQRSSLDGGTREAKPGWLRKVDNWWFGKGSPVTMSVFRILMGTVALANLAMMLPFFDAWFTERGYVPLRIVKIYFGEDPRLNLLAGVTDPRITYAFYLLVMLAALLTTVGLWTRISSIALALGYITLHHRNPMILHGGDLMLRVSLMYIALMPAGAAVSLDRLIALKRGKAPLVPAPVSLWPQRLMQYQIALVYLTTMWHKSRGHYWIDGSATWYPMHLNEFDRFWLPAFLTDNPLMVKISTWGTLAVELSLGTLVFYRPLRNWVLLAGLGLHAFIEYAFNIPLFAFTMVATYVNFYDGEEISAFVKRIRAWAGRLGVRAGPAKVQGANSFEKDEEPKQKTVAGKTGGPQ